MNKLIFLLCYDTLHKFRPQCRLFPISCADVNIIRNCCLQQRDFFFPSGFIFCAQSDRHVHERVKFPGCSFVHYQNRISKNQACTSVLLYYFSFPLLHSQFLGNVVIIWQSKGHAVHPCSCLYFVPQTSSMWQIIRNAVCWPSPSNKHLPSHN